VTKIRIQVENAKNVRPKSALYTCHLLDTSYSALELLLYKWQPTPLLSPTHLFLLGLLLSQATPCSSLTSTPTSPAPSPIHGRAQLPPAVPWDSRQHGHAWPGHLRPQPALLRVPASKPGTQPALANLYRPSRSWPPPSPNGGGSPAHVQFEGRRRPSCSYDVWAQSQYLCESCWFCYSFKNLYLEFGST
jgi:hypothetical protein